jgi:multidrug efflux pump subunit AcrA (membrane-fusion protein)
VAPKVAGYIASVPVTDNQHVNAGDVIARIDDRDYKVALAQAEGQVQASDFGVRNVDMQTVQQQSQISANEALVKQQEAALTFAQEQAARYQALYQKGAGSQETAQQYASQLEQAREAVDVAKGTRNVSQRQLETLKSLRGNALGALAQAQAQRDQAKLNLEYTTVVAAESGHMAVKNALGIGVDRDRDRLPGPHVIELRLLEVRRDPNVVRDEGRERRPRRHIFADGGGKIGDARTHGQPHFGTERAPRPRRRRT